MEWLSKDEVKRITGMSESTIERRVREGVLRREYRAVPGRKSKPVFAKDDIEKLTKPKQPIVLKRDPRKSLQLISNLPVISPNKQNGKSASHHIIPSVPLDKKLYLTLPEAVSYSGLPRSFLEEKIETHELRALYRGKYLISRKELEDLQVFDDLKE